MALINRGDYRPDQIVQDAAIEEWDGSGLGLWRRYNKLFPTTIKFQSKGNTFTEANAISYNSCKQWSEDLLDHLVKRGIAVPPTESEPAKVIHPSRIWSVDEKGVKSEHVKGVRLAAPEGEMITTGTDKHINHVTVPPPFGSPFCMH